MLIGLIADPHGNLAALDAAMRALDRHRIESLICAGDLVGFNAEHDGVVARLSGEAVSVAGNHDRVAAGELDIEHAWEGARLALRRTREALTPGRRAFLARLPTWRVVRTGVGVSHWHVDDVTRRARGPLDFVRNQKLVERRDGSVWLSVHGHTHVAGVHRVHVRDGYRIVSRLGATGTIELEDGKGWFVNPGSVDRARHGEGLASFAVLDSDARLVTFGAAEYDHRASEERAGRGGYRPGLLLRSWLAVRRLVRS